MSRNPARSVHSAQHGSVLLNRDIIMYLLDADEHWSWYVQLTALEVKEHTGTIKQKIFTGSSNSLCIDYLPQELWMSCAQACR